MRKLRHKIKFALALGLAPAALLADFDPARWEFRRPVDLAARASLVSIEVDPALYRGSRSRLTDLRVVRDGVEKPYLLRRLAGGSTHNEVVASIVDKVERRGSGVQFTLDAGRATLHDQVRIQTSADNFKQRVGIETSDDGKAWTVARDNGYIVSNSQSDAPVSSLAVRYPDSTKRFVRVTIFGWSDPTLVTSAGLEYEEALPNRSREMVSLRNPAAIQDKDSQSTLIAADLGADGIPTDEMVLQIAPGLFSRSIAIESSGDGKSWTEACQASISRTALGESLTISFPEQWSRFVRLRILNRDDQPLQIAGLVLRDHLRQIQFPAPTPGRYWLYYGGRDARQPEYDLTAILAAGPESALQIAPGTGEKNPDWRPPPPAQVAFTDRHPAVLYSILAVAILAMGYVTLRMFRKVIAGPNPP